MRQSRRRYLLLVGALVLSACTGSDPAAHSTQPSPSMGAAGQAATGFTVLDPLVDRAAHTANLLPDGRVLVAGGCVIDGCGEATASTEIFDPHSGRFVEGPSLLGPRDGQTATVLPSGDVLIVGGYSGEGEPPLATAELYVADTGSFVPAGELAIGRGGHMAALLPDGRVLIVGGFIARRTFTDSVEIWDPNTQSFEPGAAMSVARGAGTATALPDGTVLVAGGESTPGLGVASTEIYQPHNGSWVPGPNLAEPRFKHAAVALADGSVLIVGGTTDDQALLTSIERYDGSSVRPAGALAEARYKFSDAVAVLPDGRIAIAGGGRTGEYFDPRTGLTARLAVPAGGRSSFATATLLPDGSLLVIGGYDERIDLVRSAFLVPPS